jgi:UDP-N-acetylglucosamine 2-epimerase (non-hydrolysing)
MSSDPIKILTIFGTRPEVIKLAPVLRELQSTGELCSITVTTAQHREMIRDLLALFSIRPDHDLDIMRKNQSLADIATRALSGLDPIMAACRPDLVLVQGDTTTAFIGALGAFYQKIAVGHVEGGLRSFDKMHPYPEEINRRLISVVGDLHFVPTFNNRKNLEKEGVNPNGIFVTGNTVIDALLDVVNRKTRVLDRYLPDEAMSGKRMILVTAHRRENWGRPLENLCLALEELVRSFPDISVVYPVHLNPNVRKTVFEILSGKERIYLLDPLSYEPFVEAMAKAFFIITDSGGIQEEGPSLKKPVLVFRQVTERPEGVAGGGVKLVGLERETVVMEASRLLEDPAVFKGMTADHNPYGDGLAAKRIVQAILYHFKKGERPEDFAGRQFLTT